MRHEEEDKVLLDLLAHLRHEDYRFITPTPETHGRFLARTAGRTATDVRGIFGWSQAFVHDLLPASLFDRLARLGLVTREGRWWRSRVRVASLADQLLLHSAFPTEQRDAVFFGPDSYRFVRFLEAELEIRRDIGRVVDIGAGTGVGAIAAAPLLPEARITLTDVNPLALRYAKINAGHAGLEVELVEGNGLEKVTGDIDLVIANPPFMLDTGERAYRHGGEGIGAALALDWALAAARRISPGGRMVLYTGSAIVDGVDRLEATLRTRLAETGCTLRYAEIDPDIFGEQLGEPGYEEVERIAAVGAVIERS